MIQSPSYFAFLLSPEGHDQLKLSHLYTCVLLDSMHRIASLTLRLTVISCLTLLFSISFSISSLLSFLVFYLLTYNFLDSPIKKKGGTSAGLPRASGERSSPVPNGAAREVSELCISLTVSALLHPQKIQILLSCFPFMSLSPGVT